MIFKDWQHQQAGDQRRMKLSIDSLFILTLAPSLIKITCRMSRKSSAAFAVIYGQGLCLQRIRRPTWRLRPHLPCSHPFYCKTAMLQSCSPVGRRMINPVPHNDT